MRKLIIILILIFISCSSDKKNSLTEQFKFLEPKFESEVKLDFSKNGIDLIEDFENQIQKDFCESSHYINGLITKNKEELSFPLVVYKYCGALTHFRNRISVIINANNEVLIDQEFVTKSTDNLKINLVKATKNLFESENKKNIVYLLEWDTKVSSLKMTDRFLEIFSATKVIMNNLSLEKYGKEVSTLNEYELSELKKEYNPMIGIEQSTIIFMPE
ncbi:hypothetical protein [Lacinutrix undariae]